MTATHKNFLKTTISAVAGSGLGAFTIDAASSGYRTFGAGDDGLTFDGVTISEGTAWEVRNGCVYTHSGTSLSRGTLMDSSTGSAIAFTSAAVVSQSGAAGFAALAHLAMTSVIPGGRLTLESGVAVSTADQSAKTSVFYTPFTHQIVPLWDGYKWAPFEFSELTNVLTNSATGSAGPAAVVGETCYDLFVWDNAGTVTLTRGPAWAEQATVTMTIATPCVVTWTGSPMRSRAPIVFSTSGALPTGITAGTTYYVARGASPAENAVWGNTFSLATSAANAASNTLVNTTGSQSGTHTATSSTRGRGTGSGTTELEYFQGRWVNKYDITNGPVARKGLFVGTFCTNPSAQTEDKAVGGSASIGGRLIANYFNRVGRAIAYIAGSSSHSYTSTTPREYNNSTAPCTHWIVPLLGEQKTTFAGTADMGGNGARICPSVNSITYGAAQASSQTTTGISATAVDAIGGNAFDNPNKTVGANWISLVEVGQTSGTFNFGILSGLVDI